MNAIHRTLGVLAILAVCSVWTLSGVGQDATGPSQRSQVVILSQDGLVSGQVVAIDAPSKLASPLSETSVHFVQDGSVVRSSVTDEHGNFVIEGLTPGVYSFIGSGGKGFIAYGVVVKAWEEGTTTDSFMVAPAVSPRFIALREIVARFLPTKKPALLEEVEVSTSLNGLDDVAPGANRVLLNNGTLTGTVRSIASDPNIAETRVFLVQNDTIVSETKVSANGAFSIDDVKAGVYDFVAAGPAGFVAVGFEAIQESDEKTIIQQDVPSGQEGSVIVQEPGPVTELDHFLTPPADNQVVADQLEHASDLSGEVAANDVVPGGEMLAYGDALGCGAACGATGCGCEEEYYEEGMGCGDCCGGGAGGFYGGWGLLPAALLAWAITEIDDDNPNNPPPSSPTQ